MKERNWRKWEFAGLFAVLGAGNLLHFVYDWSGGSAVAAVFAAVNESVWEHMKLLAAPWLVWTVIEAAALRSVRVLPGRMAGLAAGLAAIPALYYTYTGATGENISLVNILIFQAAVLLAAAVSRHLQEKRSAVPGLLVLAAGAAALVTAALFVRWTFAPPPLPLFTDPGTGLAGPAAIQ